MHTTSDPDRLTYDLDFMTKPRKRKAKFQTKFTYYGIVRRVARKLGLNENYVTHVRHGLETSRPVMKALRQEQRLMDREAANKKERRGNNR